MLTLAASPIREVVVLGAHCDDIAIGAGGTLLHLANATPGLRVRALVMTGGNTARHEEEWAALNEFCPESKVELTVLDLPDGRLPGQWSTVKDALHMLREQSNPDLVFAPVRHDAHQDHRLVAELVPTTFRDQLILGYEIIKWESDLANPSIYQPLDSHTAERKAELIMQCYPSQADKPWLDRETFLGIARIRGVQCRNRYAEAFFADKLAINLTGA